MEKKIIFSEDSYLQVAGDVDLVVIANYAGTLDVKDFIGEVPLGKIIQIAYQNHSGSVRVHFDTAFRIMGTTDPDSRTSNTIKLRSGESGALFTCVKVRTEGNGSWLVFRQS